MARTKSETPGKSEARETIACTVPKALAAFIEDYRWENRLSRSEVVAKALAEWAGQNGFPKPADK
jgi:hypothetical protein